MASTGGFAGVSLAEAYVMRKQYKEKMKKMMETEKAEKGILVAGDEKNKDSNVGCFFWGSKKTHAAQVSSVDYE